MIKGDAMNTNAKNAIKVGKEEVACFPPWFLTVTGSKPRLVVFAITVVICAPLLMVFGALYPLFKR
jgi:hypothetical protein